MLKLKKLKDLFIVTILGVILVAMCQTGVEASSPIIITNNTFSSIPTTQNKVENTAKPTVSGTNNAVKNTANKATNNTSSKLPQAGLDYSVLLVIAACVISGVYAYTKIKDYNDIKY